MLKKLFKTVSRRTIYLNFLRGNGMLGGGVTYRN